MLLFHAGVAINQDRYNLILILPYAISGAWLVEQVLGRNSGAFVAGSQAERARQQMLETAERSNGATATEEEIRPLRYTTNSIQRTSHGWQSFCRVSMTVIVAANRLPGFSGGIHPRNN